MSAVVQETREHFAPQAQGGSEKPIPLKPNFANIPADLKLIPNWLLFRYLPPKRKGGKWRKVPFQPNGKTASTTRRSTWRRFDECVDAYTQGGFDGVGFVFDGEPDECGLVYAGVDFDSAAFESDCVIRVGEWLDRIGSYVEASVSGQGLHVILKAPPLASGISHAGIELYTSARYFTMTGHTGGAAKPLIAASAAFAALAKELQANGNTLRKAPLHEPTPTSNVVSFELPEWAVNGRPAAAFADLPLEPRTDIHVSDNIEKIRNAVDAIPPAAIATEPEWMKFARALAHQAALSKDQEEQLWDVLDTASRGAPGYHQDDNRSRWERYVSEAFNKENPITIATVFDLAYKHGWEGWSCPHFSKGKSPLNLRRNGGELKYEPVSGHAPELAKLENVWLTRIFEGDTDGKYEGDYSRLAFGVAIELVRAGLDDTFIARVLMTTKCGEHVQENPARRLERTIDRAHEFVIDPDLEKMNSKHAVLPIGSKTHVVTWGPDLDFPDRRTIVRAQTFSDFTNLHSNKRKVSDTGEIGDDGKPIKKKIPLGGWWLRQERRRQYDGGQRFLPQHDAEVVGDTLNMYSGFAVQPRKPEGCSGAAGCQLFLDHGFKIICSGNEEHWNYLLKREAWIIQHRRRSEIAAAYRTEAEGSGKGFWCTHLGRLFGSHFMQVSNPDHVIGKHNPHLETLIKLCADEALFVGDPRHRNALFSMISEPTLTIEPKFVGVYPATNHLNIDITTNSKHFVPASRTARRFFIPTVSENRVGDLEYFRTIETQLKGGGYEALLYHLLNEVDLRDFDVRRVPKTAGLAEQVEYSRKGLDGLVEKICSEGRVPCAHAQWPGFSISHGSDIKQGFDYFIDTHHDRELRDLQALKVKRQLRRDWGCFSGDDAKRRDGAGMTYGVKWPALADLRASFVERHGPQEWLHPEVTEWPTSPSAQELNDQDLPADCRGPVGHP